MSFGTGHHETTRSVIRLMQDLNFTDKTVMDLGCGTGILGILAERLGAAHVHMLDNDPQAVSNAEDNLTANTTTRTTVAVGTAENLTENRYDVIIANITRNILIEAAPYIHTALRQGGQVLLSGFFVDDIQPLMAVYSQYGFVVSKQTSENQWAALCLSRAV
jgi:ribosomal protein L11 methyltransferase